MNQICERLFFARPRREGCALKDLENMKKDLKDLFTSQRLGVLATQNEGQPYTSLVAFSASEDLKQLFFATTRTTRKYANLTANSRVAMLIDNRSNEVIDFRWAMAVTATGKAEEIKGHEREEASKLYLAKHPHLEEFVSSPSCALLRISVDRYYVASRFQKVIQVHVKP